MHLVSIRKTSYDCILKFNSQINRSHKVISDGQGGKQVVGNRLIWKAPKTVTTKEAYLRVKRKFTKVVDKMDAASFPAFCKITEDALTGKDDCCKCTHLMERHQVHSDTCGTERQEIPLYLKG